MMSLCMAVCKSAVVTHMNGKRVLSRFGRPSSLFGKASTLQCHSASWRCRMMQRLHVSGVSCSSNFEVPGKLTEPPTKWAACSASISVSSWTAINRVCRSVVSGQLFPFPHSNTGRDSENVTQLHLAVVASRFSLSPMRKDALPCPTSLQHTTSLFSRYTLSVFGLRRVHCIAEFADDLTHDWC